MSILQIGVPKSGNFWLYQIIQQILICSNRHSSSFIEKHTIHALAKNWELNYPTQANIDMIDITDLKTFYRISSIFKMPVENLKEYVSETPHVWTHSPVCKKSGEVFNAFEKKVYIIRDPRDVAISASKYYCSDYFRKYYPQPETDPEKFLQKNFDRLMLEWVWHVWDHLRISQENNIHIAFFEGFKLNFKKELNLLLKYLKIDLSEAEKEELEEAVSFSTLKKKNPKHLKKGKSGYWMDQLSDEQINRAEMIAGPLIKFLGYPERNSEIHFSRSFPHSDFSKLKKDIIISQQPVYN